MLQNQKKSVSKNIRKILQPNRQVSESFHFPISPTDLEHRKSQKLWLVKRYSDIPWKLKIISSKPTPSGTIPQRNQPLGFLESCACKVQTYSEIRKHPSAALMEKSWKQVLEWFPSVWVYVTQIFCRHQCIVIWPISRGTKVEFRPHKERSKCRTWHRFQNKR